MVLFSGYLSGTPFLFSYHTDFDYFVINTIFTEIFLEYDKEDNY